MPSDALNTWFAYGYREGIPRMLDLWDRHGVKVTWHMIDEGARRHPELAREIVARGHEAAGHGPRWSSQYAMSRDEEKQFLIAARDMVGATTERLLASDVAAQFLFAVLSQPGAFGERTFLYRPFVDRGLD